MIKVKEITIKEFRGIRDLTLKFNNNNFTVCGPNGTGKSGVVDALEFVLTGNVSRLSGEGTGDVSLKIHGPHVDSRNRPDKSKVSIIIFIPSLNKEVQIERCVDNISNPQITPNDSEVMKILDKVVSHPEFVLSRRELIRYIISKPGKRSEEVQALLRLNKIDIFRKKLNTVSNSYQRAVLPLQREKQIAGDQLSLALGITELKPKLLLEEVNKRRAVLSLDPIDNLISTTSLKDGLTTAKSLSSNSISKEQAEKDIVKINSIFNEIDSSEIQNLLVSIIGSLNKIKNDEEEIKKTVSCDSLFRAALDLIEEDKCPVCDTAWEMDKLVKLIQEKRDSIKETNEKCSLIKKDINKISLIIANLKSSVELIKNYGNLLKPVINVEVLENYILTIDDFTTKLGLMRNIWF